jgi:hypothetical protein
MGGSKVNDLGMSELGIEAESRDWSEIDAENRKSAARIWGWIAGVLIYAVSFSLICAAFLAFARWTGDRAATEATVISAMFPIGNIAEFLVLLTQGFFNIVLGPLAGALISLIPAFLLALPVGVAHGLGVWALWVVFRSVQQYLSRSVRARSAADK